jgi:hypothetical protein
MAWYRSALVAQEHVVLHIFICPRCNGIGQTKTHVQPPPKK